MRKTLRREYFRRVKMVLRTELYGRNKILAINGCALPVLGGPGNFSLCTVSTILQQTLTGCKIRVTPRAVEGYNRSSRHISLVLWGWIVTFVTALIPSCKWCRSVMLGGPLIRSNAWPVSLLHSCRGISLRTSHKACMAVGPSCVMVSLSKHLRQMQNISARAAVLFVYSPGAGILCMVSIVVLLRNHLCMDMKRWLKSSNLPAATEGLVVAAQDQALRTQYYESNILHRFSQSHLPLVQCRPGHIVAGCSALAPMDYNDRHNQEASIIHWNICRHFGVPVERRWYRHHPDRLVEMDDIIMMWDTPTAGKISANHPDICFRNRKTKTCLLIDISYPADGNITRK